MSGPKAKPPDDDEPQEHKSGRVAFDERGNAIWEWSMSTGAFGRNVDTKRLKKLEANDLKIAEDPASPSRTAGPRRAPGGGFDPYDSSGSGMARGQAKPKQAPRQKDLRRLSEWIQLQKKLGKKTDPE